MTDIRLERWGNHYGTPTITFLLTYNAQIEKTHYIFGLASSTTDESPKPWDISNTERFTVDQKNSVLVDESQLVLYCALRR